MDPLSFKTDFHVCGVCGIRFPQVGEFVAHKKSGCGYTVAASLLPGIVQSQPKDEYVVRMLKYCDICKKELCNENYKKIHMKKVHGDSRAEKTGLVKGKVKPMDPKSRMLERFKASLSDSRYSFLCQDDGGTWGMPPEWVFDRMIERAVMGNKVDLEKAVYIFLNTYKTDPKNGRRKSAYLHPGTRQLYWNFLRKGIREYSDGRVELELNPNTAPPHQHFEDRKSEKEMSQLVVPHAILEDSETDIDVTSVDHYQGVRRWHNPDVSKVEFPTKCPYCPSSTEEIYLTEPSLEAHYQVYHHGISFAEYVNLLKEETKTEELCFNVKSPHEEKITEDADDSGKPWWDGCIYKCKHCGANLPGSDEIKKHIYEEHKSYEERAKVLKYGKEHNSHGRSGLINKDYEAFKITYWHCKFCALNKKSFAGKGIVQRSIVTIKAHLRAQHDISSIEEYEDKVRDPAALRAEVEKAPSPKPEPRRSLRQNQKSTENFRKLATGTTTCKICKKEGIKRLEKHLSENHNITSLEEYEEVAMYVPKFTPPSISVHL